jgi:hypothetical protein
LKSWIRPCLIRFLRNIKKKTLIFFTIFIQVLVDRTLCCSLFFSFNLRWWPPLFFNIDIFSYKQHFSTFYVSLYDIYTINTIKQ